MLTIILALALAYEEGATPLETINPTDHALAACELASCRGEDTIAEDTGYPIDCACLFECVESIDEDEERDDCIGLCD